ncbi:MAG: esterase/lipase/thioesterase, partial [Ignavibacteria bacterium]
MKKLIAAICLLCLLASVVKVIAQAAKLPYPIIFVHGLSGSDETFKVTMGYMRDQFLWGGQSKSIYVFDAVLNADNNDNSSIMSDDVKWENFSSEGRYITVGKRNFDEDRNNFITGWSDNNVRLFAINFAEERIRGAWGVNDFFDHSNEAAIFKQGKALGEMIKQVLEFTGCKKVILIGHSMGGLAIREYLQRLDGIGKPSWWVNKNDIKDGHKVAKVVTIGTPHYGFERAYILPFETKRLGKVLSTGIPNIKSEAVRDLSVEVEEKALLVSKNFKGPYLFGGLEKNAYQNTWTGINFFNQDINCDGNNDGTIVGINAGTSTFYKTDNPDMSLPRNIDYTWIVATNSGGKNDDIVLADRQFLDEPGDTLRTIISVASGLEKWVTHMAEGAAYQPIIRGMDEPSTNELAYELKTGESYIGLISRQTFNNTTDKDVFTFKLASSAKIKITVVDDKMGIVANHSGVTKINLLDSSNVFKKAGNVYPFTIEYDAPAGEYYLHVSGKSEGEPWKNPYRIKVETTEMNLAADFDYNISSGIAPLIVKFSDKSAGVVTKREWDFDNDGTIDSYEQNPEHYYYQPGTYSVKLIIYDGSNTDYILKSNIIKVTEDIIISSNKLAIAEYYFDNDPGQGNANKINVLHVSDYLINTKLDVSGLENGIHILGFRVKDTDAKWSHTYNKIFIKESFSNNVTSTIVYGEYFYDTDPGIGNGYSISFTPSTNISLFKLFDLKELSNGIHTLTVRFKDTHGKWSQNFTKMFLKERFSKNETVVIVKLEYYIDQDPGYDLATPVPLVSVENIEKNFFADLSKVASGIHTVYLRAKDNYNAWSHLYSKTFLKESYTAIKTLKRLEYFIDSDPGYGYGIQIGNVSTEKDSVTFIADLKNISPGIHLFNCRALDSENKWSLLFSKMFLVENSSQSKLITEVEYFFNEDPGYGKGNKVTFNPSSDLTIQLNPDLKLLLKGKNTLFIRVKDSMGSWSFLSGHEFEKVADVITKQIALKTGWNMVSMPVKQNEMKPVVLFPNKESLLFGFNDGYKVDTAFVNGKGYWLKNSKSEVVP